MKIVHVNPQGGGQVAALGGRFVGRGEVVDVPEDVAALLLIQPANWSLTEKPSKADAEFAAAVIAAHRAALDAASNPTPEPIETPGEGDHA